MRNKVVKFVIVKVVRNICSNKNDGNKDFGNNISVYYLVVCNVRHFSGFP